MLLLLLCTEYLGAVLSCTCCVLVASCIFLLIQIDFRTCISRQQDLSRFRKLGFQQAGMRHTGRSGCWWCSSLLVVGRISFIPEFIINEAPSYPIMMDRYYRRYPKIISNNKIPTNPIPIAAADREAASRPLSAGWCCCTTAALQLRTTVQS